MGERKVINHYISPDFDHSIIPRTKKDKKAKTEVRTMIPFSMRCDTCNEYMYLGKKFNCKMERLEEFYMKTRILRFYIKCCVCSAEITYKTDPQNSGYTLESGASRNFELWRDTETTQEEAKKQRQEDDELDAMKKLENSTMDNKAEMDTLDALDEMRAINQRHERVDHKAVLAALLRPAAGASSSSTAGPGMQDEVGEDGLTASERALAKATFNNRRRTLDSDDEADMSSAAAGAPSRGIADRVAEQLSASASAAGAITIVRKKRKIESSADGSSAGSATSNGSGGTEAAATSGLAGLAAYDSD